MKTGHIISVVSFAVAMAASAPAVAQFDQLNKALGDLSKQIENGKKKGEKGAAGTANQQSQAPGTSESVHPQGQQQAGPGEKFCPHKKLGCFTGEKTTYQGKFEITGLRLGRVDIATLNKRIAQNRCSIDYSSLSNADWQESAKQGNYSLDQSLPLDNVQEYMIACSDRETGAIYEYFFIGDPNFPEFFASSGIKVRTEWDGRTKSFNRETPLIKSLIDKFGEPSGIQSAKVWWDGEKGELAGVYPEKRNRNEIVVVATNSAYVALFLRDAHNRISESNKRNAPNKAVPKL